MYVCMYVFGQVGVREQVLGEGVTEAAGVREVLGGARRWWRVAGAREGKCGG